MVSRPVKSFFSDITSPVNTKNFQNSIQGFKKPFISNYLIFRYWLSRRSCFAGGLGSLRYGIFFELTTYRLRTAYLLFLFSCTQNVFGHLNIICQTFGKLISSLDSDVFIFYHHSLACCFLIHWENHLWSNLTPTYFSQNTKYFVISEVCLYTFTNSIFDEMR